MQNNKARRKHVTAVRNEEIMLSIPNMHHVLDVVSFNLLICFKLRYFRAIILKSYPKPLLEGCNEEKEEIIHQEGERRNNKSEGGENK